MDWSYSKQLEKHIRTELIKTTNGQIAYCLTHGLKSPNGEDLPEMGKTDNIVYRVLLNGYPQKSPEQLGVSNWQEAHYSTQLAIWNALGQLSVSELEHHNANVEKAANAIIYAANHSQDTQDITMNVIPAEQQKATLKGEFFETNLYVVESNAKNGSFKVQTNNAPSGVKIVSENGEAKDQFDLGEKFRILIPKNTKTGEFSLKVASNLNKLQAIAYKGTETIQNATVLLERNEEKVSADLAVNWEALGSLQVKKVGDNNEALKGAVFEIFSADNESVGTITTGEDGIATLSNLAIGTYTVKEVKAPEGHVLNPKPQTIEIKTGEIATIQLKNETVKGNIEIKKVSDSGKVLTGVEFTVFKEDGNAVTKVTTDKNGIAKVSGLKYGKYYFQESKGVDGYLLNKTKYPFEIKEHNKTLTFEVQNQQVKGNVQLLKVDQDGEKKLEGAVFILADENGKQISEHKTDKNGLIKIDNLTFGKYQFIEKASPNGYILVKEPIPFSITENGKTIELVAKNNQIKGSLEITKVDVADGNNKLPNAEFTIYNEQGQEIVKNKTNEDGIAKFEKLPFGKYKYRETLAPEGYVLNEETFEFEIKEDGQIIKHVVEDRKIEGTLEITKVDVADGNNKLPNAEFTIYNEQGQEIVKNKTNEDGIAKFEKLPYGKYTYKETFAPEGYLINEETFSFEIKEDGEIIKHTVQDKKKSESKPEKPSTSGDTPKQPDKNISTPAKAEVEKVSKSGVLPVTGANLSMWFSIGAGIILLVVGSMLFMKRKNG
ncbi:SpaA isopeptide-forming pilin-related protein [Bacillus albus]|uniref:SpaA isopeptide-forming pilin-related protein n=1 Tax=Bacillus cereus group TaxID=86661 RepID=UPI003D6DA3A6